jgi:hypothetical protein
MSSRPEVEEKPARYLTREQCDAAFEVFNHFQNSVENLEIIWLVMPRRFFNL